MPLQLVQGWDYLQNANGKGFIQPENASVQLTGRLILGGVKIVNVKLAYYTWILQSKNELFHSDLTLVKSVS